MSTKQSTQQQQATTFDPESMGRYQTAQAQSLAGWQNFAQNPLTASYFRQNLGMLNRQASQLGQTGLQNLLLNTGQLTRGTNVSPLLTSETAMLNRGTQANQSNALLQSLAQALGLQTTALGALQGFQPLTTGATGSATTTTSGLGTWLPQLIGTGLSAAMGGFGGGLMGGGSKGGSSWMTPQTSNMLQGLTPGIQPYNPGYTGFSGPSQFPMGAAGMSGYSPVMPSIFGKY